MGVFLPTLPTLGTAAPPQHDTPWTATTAPKGPEQANPLPTLIGVVVQSIVEVAILCAVGWYLAKRGIVDAKAKKVSEAALRFVQGQTHTLQADTATTTQTLNKSELPLPPSRHHTPSQSN